MSEQDKQSKEKKDPMSPEKIKEHEPTAVKRDPSDQNIVEPGGTGTPAFLAKARLVALFSKAFIAREFGPMKRMLHFSQTSAK